MNNFDLLEQTLRDVGDRLRGARKAQGWSVREVSERSGVSERFVFQVEKGQANVSLKTLGMLAEAFGLTLGTLFGEGAKREESLDERLGRCTEEELRKVKTRVDGMLGGGVVRLVALLGMKGAGKSAVGARLAQALDAEFIELDSDIEALSGLTLAELFSLHGAEYYEEIQEKALAKLVARGVRAVVATGGGIVGAKGAVRMLERNALRVWLKASPQVHWERVVAQGDRRPIDGYPRAYEQLCATWEARAPKYRESDWTVDTDKKGIHEAVEEILRLVTESGRFWGAGSASAVSQA